MLCGLANIAVLIPSSSSPEQRPQPARDETTITMTNTTTTITTENLMTMDSQPKLSLPPVYISRARPQGRTSLTMINGIEPRRIKDVFTYLKIHISDCRGIIWEQREVELIGDLRQEAREVFVRMGIPREIITVCE